MVTSHKCEHCSSNLSDEEILFLDDLEEKLDEGVSALGLDQDLCQNLFYIGGFLAFKQEDLRGEAEDWEDEQHFTAFLKSLDRGSLQYPSPKLFLYTVLCYLFFKNSEYISCRNRLVAIFENISTFFYLNLAISKPVNVSLVNILLKD